MRDPHEKDVQQRSGKEQILEAALVTFAHKGYVGASIRDIAQQAELSLSALYYYFPSKQAALFALVEATYDTYNRHANRIVEETAGNPLSQIAHGVRHLVDYRCVNLLSSRVVILETGHLEGEFFHRVQRMQDEARKTFEDVVTAGIQEGVFTTCDPVLAIRTVNAFCNAIPQWYTPGGQYTIESIQRTYVLYTLKLLGYNGEIDLDPFFNSPVDCSAVRLDPTPTNSFGEDPGIESGLRFPPL